MLEKVNQNISTAQGKQKQTYDRKHATPCEFQVRKYIIYLASLSLQVGTLVFRKDFRRKKCKGEKMDAKWLGPFLLSSEIGKSFYSHASLDGKTALVKRINGAHLKVYKRSS